MFVTMPFSLTTFNSDSADSALVVGLEERIFVSDSIEGVRLDKTYIKINVLICLDLQNFHYLFNSI